MNSSLFTLPFQRRQPFFYFLPFYLFTFKKFLLNRSHLVQEDQENAHRAHEPHKEEEDAEKAAANRSPVGKLVTH
ncbi:MAG: hypothetical protein SPE75_00915, partial [Prevotella sp.]|nr:hypothetical protein [Prevotella sp.]